MEKRDTQSAFFGKKILIGVSGSIAAYKIPELVRLFVKNGAEVKVVLTKDAVNFVAPLTLSTVSDNDVILDFVDDTQVKWNNHVDLALWADIFLIAPATANSLAKMASGFCDNILLATFLSAKCPVFCAPAMDRDMYLHASTLKNVRTLKKRGVHVFDTEEGELASGLYGLGRMQDIQLLFSDIERFFLKSMPLFGKKILITAGPTYEKIDPVRFIGNFSSGKMGCELAKQAAHYGAHVDLILGPSYQIVTHPFINVCHVENAEQMFVECNKRFNNCDIAIFSAAVSDFKPKQIIKEKIKQKSIVIHTEPNPDIITELASKKKDQFIVGFALETENEEKNAIKKMQQKNMDLIVLNSLKDQAACFGYDTNKVKIIDRDLSVKKYPLMEKSKVASLILDEILFKRNYYASIKEVL